MFDYEIKSGKRRTVAVEIKNGKVILRVPSNYVGNARLMRFAEDFVRSKQAWIEKKLAASEKNEDLLHGFAEREKIYLFGYEIEKKFDAQCRKTVFENGTLILPARCGNTADLEKELKKWYKKFAFNELYLRLEAYSARCGKNFNKFGLTSAKGKWGSCSSDKKILLCWRLIILPDELIEYVIIHELCHTEIMNHSQRFWSEVEKYVPDYRNRRKELKRYNSIMNKI